MGFAQTNETDKEGGKNAADARVVEIDMRETTAEGGGQEIMTSDKVSLRMNALVTYRIADARKAVSSTDDVRPALGDCEAM